MPHRQLSLSLSGQAPPPSYQGQHTDDPHVPGYAFEPYAPSPPPSTTTHHPISTMGLPQPKEKDKPHIMIIPDTPYLALKGTGPDVEPTTLSGNVVLYLTESTTLKEITLQFRGKARIPMPANESLINNSTYITYVVCNHDWSFLESGSSSSSSSSHKRHSRTLKAGKHYFPFSLSIGGTLPSSITTPALGGASVAYKLRAVATRTGLAHNLQTIIPVPLLRTFTPEALEYQQTLEIENTWPDKMMYAIMLPHKAWAAGDTLGAVVKFSPLGKGVRVASVVSTLWETTKMYARSGTQEDTRPVCSIRHEIVDGRAVEVDWSSNPSGSKSAGTDSGGRSKLGAFNFGIGNSRPTSAQGYRDFGYTDPSASGPSSASGSDGMTEQARRRLQREQDEEQERLLGYENHDVVACIKMPIPLSSFDYSASGNASAVGTPTHTPYSAPSSASTSTSHFPSLSLSSHSNHSPTSPFAGVAGSSSSSTPPVLVTPSHALEPVVVSHRLRWSIFIQNRDGHISELRCSLPVTILDGRLKEEARDASLVSRRMMVRSCPGLSDTLESDDEEVWGINRDGEDAGEGAVGSRGVAGEDGLGRGDRELPSYTAHVRDRVANMFLPEAVTVRVGNPWVVGGGSAGGSVASMPTSPAALLVDNDPLSFRPALVSALSAGESGASASTIASTPGSGNEAADAHVMSHLPHAPPPTGSGASTPLDWVNSELLLSLSGDAVRRFGGGEANVGTPGTGTFSPVPGGMRTPPSVLQYVAPVPGAYGGSRWGSRVGSRANSRAASPERGGGNDHHHSGEHPEREGRSRPSSPVNAPASLGYVYEPLPSAPIGSGASSHKRATGDASSSSHESHGSGHGMRNLQSLFKATMKPFTALSLGGKHRHDDKDHHHPHHQHREGSSTSHSREGSTANSRSSSPVPDQSIHTSSTYPASSAASTYTYTADSVMNLPLSTSHDPIASPVASRVSEDQSVLTTASSSASLHANTQPQAHSSSSLGQPSMSTSELTSLRRAAISSPYAQANVQQQQQLQTQQQQQLSGPALLHRALTEVPDYSIASRGFIGGVAPLSSMKGLPSYQEAVGHGGQQTYGSYQTYHQGGGRRPSPLSGSENSAGEGSSHIPTNTGTNASPPPPPNGPRRSAASVPNLTSHFAQSLTVSSGSNTTPPVPPIPTYVSGAAEDEEREVGILQRLESAGAISGLGTVAGPYTAPQRQREDDEDDDDEDGNGIEMRTRSHTVTRP
ncbi:Arrestin domain-containing protein C31A2.12 [Psilocybe cubensis]|uniref:Arrestin C-terminal-like domain-containing protein n=2 Tax=Psilocybe cubensis TaxID=181762 RepID=A0A8H7Y1U2_PSICU|nr:Arrestin domain-containing protein C31A2.12 [Psilocybe cubensis]KAH9483841.1 Arrestin domain-containing protein C31A2.12 [Psilocybe cubensis]